MNLVSVVIPCFNHGQYLEEAVDSVLSQTYQNFEVVIVNDGSTDQFTHDLLKGFDKPKCNVIHTENRGLSAARNTGILNTKGQYVCCLDADDKYHPDYFQKAVEVFGEDKDLRYGAVPAWVQLFGSSNVLWKTIGHNSEGFEPFLQGVRNNIHSSTIFRRICWERIGGYDESMTSGYEDWDFWIKMLTLGYEWFCLDEILIYYRQKDRSMVTEAHEKRTELLKTIITNNYSFYSKHMLPIIQELDNEVFLLKKRNEELIKNEGKVSDLQDDNILTRLRGKIKQLLTKFIRNSYYS